MKPIILRVVQAILYTSLSFHAIITAIYLGATDVYRQGRPFHPHLVATSIPMSVWTFLVIV